MIHILLFVLSFYLMIIPKTLASFLHRYLKAEDTVLGIPIVLEANLNGYTITGHLGFRF
jgi:hypothetical protein